MLAWCNDLLVAIDAMSSSGMAAMGAPSMAAASLEQALYTNAKANHYAAYPPL